MKTENKMGPLSRRGLFKPDSFKEGENSVQVVFASSEPADMYSWRLGSFKEILSMDPAHIRLGRMQKGVSVLDNHDQYGSVKKVVLGRANSPTIEGEEALVTMYLSDREDNKGLVNDVQKGFIADVSVGYRVYKYEELTLPGEEVRTLKAVDWEPYEVSFVPVPADVNAQVRNKKEENEYEFEIISREDSLKNRNASTEPVTEPVVEPAATPAAAPASEPAAAPVAQAETEQARCLEINDTCQRHGLKPEFARKLITDNVSIDQARKLIIDKIAEEKPSMHQNNNTTVLVDERDKKRHLAETGIALRLGVSMKDITNEERAYVHLSLVEMAKELDPSLRMLSKKEIASRAMMSSSDFPLLLGNVANKLLAKSYGVAPRTFMPFVNKVTLTDFKESTKIITGAAPQLLKIAEGGEYEYGTIGEGAEKMRLSKFGRKIRFTEEMFMNDSLGSLNDLPKKFGFSAAALESAIVYGILTGNPNLSDGIALFHATHGNLGTAGAISETTLDEGYQKFADQKDGNLPLNILPKFLIAGSKNRVDAKKILSSLTTAGKAADINVFQNDLDLIIDANISGKEWFLAADPNQIETIDIGYLEGAEGPEVKSIADEANDSIIIKCKHYFVAGAQSHKGLFKNPRT